jgi:O-acetyl-ADP-ribose deacetylase (regulator of RNase III)
LKIAAENGARSIAFPSLGTGVYGIPIERACAVAIAAAAGDKTFEKIVFCCFSAGDADIYRAELSRT